MENVAEISGLVEECFDAVQWAVGTDVDRPAGATHGEHEGVTRTEWPTRLTIATRYEEAKSRDQSLFDCGAAIDQPRRDRNLHYRFFGE